MTKEEYLKLECASCYGYKTCGWRHRGETCNTLRNCARAWDKAVESFKEKAEKLYKEGKIDSYALKLLFEDEQHPVDAGRKQAKEKH